MRIEIRDGLLFDDNGEVIPAPRADEIAQANDWMYAERMTAALADKAVNIDPATLQIAGLQVLKRRSHAL